MSEQDDGRSETEAAAEISFSHKPVLLQECLEGLKIKPDGVYLDGTLGGAGHSAEILKRLGKNGRLIGIDRDGDAVAAAGKRLAATGSEARFDIVRGNFAEMREAAASLGVSGADGILLDLGVSSYQFDTGERGFSYRFDARLDMRMDTRETVTAADIVNTYTEKQLGDLLLRYGEERWARRIAAFVVRERKKARIETTFQLTEIIKMAIPAAARRDGHPAKRTFQALRIEVNGELEALRRAIREAVLLLNPGGRLCIISFHSLEEKLVKQLFKKEEHPCECPPDFPVCVCGKKPTGKMITAKPILPGEKEIEENPRAKSAKLRIFERI